MTSPEERGQPFWKMTGSGNDFVFFDDRDGRNHAWRAPAAIARLCDRRRGVGADGVVFIESTAGAAAFRMSYYNSDGSRASMCGNAALCSTRLATDLGLGPAAGFDFDTDAGPVSARMRDGRPEIDLPGVRGLQPVLAGVSPEGDESRIGFATAGVPHVVVLCADADGVDVARRGGTLRRHGALGAAGANANFVSRDDGERWSIRTYERGVEAETLACGTGAIAAAALIEAWGLGGRPTVELRTRSGLSLEVRFGDSRAPDGVASLRGEGRLVYDGVLRQL